MRCKRTVPNAAIKIDCRLCSDCYNENAFAIRLRMGHLIHSRRHCQQSRVCLHSTPQTNGTMTSQRMRVIKWNKTRRELD